MTISKNLIAYHRQPLVNINTILDVVKDDDMSDNPNQKYAIVFLCLDDVEYWFFGDCKERDIAMLYVESLIDLAIVENEIQAALN